MLKNTFWSYETPVFCGVEVCKIKNLLELINSHSQTTKQIYFEHSGNTQGSLFFGRVLCAISSVCQMMTFFEQHFLRSLLFFLEQLSEVYLWQCQTSMKQIFCLVSQRWKAKKNYFYKKIASLYTFDWVFNIPL